MYKTRIAEKIRQETEKVRSETKKRIQRAVERTRKAQEKIQIFEANQISAAKKLFALGLAIEQISEVLNLPIEKVRNSINN